MTAWRLVEDLRIGTAAEGPQSFSTVAGLEVDGAGRIYVIDRQAQEIRLFDSTGTFVRRIGRPGRGPGEFVGANGLAWDPDGRLWVVDQKGERYTLFDATGRVLKTQLRGLLWYGWRWEGTVDTGGRLLENQTLRGGPEPVPVILRFDRGFARTDTFPFPRAQLPDDFFRFEQGSTVLFTSIPFAPKLHWRIDPRGRLWFGASDRYRIVVRRLEGDTLRIVERAEPPIPVSGAEADSAAALVAKAAGDESQVDRSRIPRVKPAFSGVSLDDAGRLWVHPAVRAGESKDVLDVFDPDGRYLGRVTVPFAFSSSQPVVIRRDRFYTVTEDADGVPYVVRARIVGGAPGTVP
jgi:sugar lactone lactonase YvrE